MSPNEEASTNPLNAQTNRTPWWRTSKVLWSVPVLAMLVAAPSMAQSDSEPNVGQVLATSLQESYDADAEITFGDQRPANHPASGTVTWLGPIGEELAAGQVIYEIDASPTVFLAGDVPAFRPLDTSVSGPDVAQLETNLVALGYDPDGTVSVDEDFTGATADMVERWQEDLGLEESGTIPLGQVVFAPDQRRIDSYQLGVGDVINAGDQILTTSSTERIVTLYAPTAETVDLTIGSPIEVVLPDRSSIEARIVSAVVSDNGAGPERTLTGTISGELNDAPSILAVTARWNDNETAEALTVPTAALMRFDSGEYVVEKVDADGTTVIVPVVPSESSGGRVEVTGDLTNGDQVVVP